MPGRGTYIGEEKRVLQLGGLAGLLTGILWFVSGTIYGVRGFAASTEEYVASYLEGTFAVLSTVANGLFMVAALLAIPLFLALYRALRKTSLASASFGCALAVLALVVVALAGATRLVSDPALAGLYVDAPTSQDRATVVYLWEGALLVFQTFRFAAFLLAAISFVSLGVAMVGAPGFGKGFGGVSVILGFAAPVGFVVSAVYAVPIFLLLFGWKVYSLSRVPGAG